MIQYMKKNMRSFPMDVFVCVWGVSPTYFQNPISPAGWIRTKFVPGTSTICSHETTRSPMILLPGVVPPTAPPTPRLKHRVCKEDNSLLFLYNIYNYSKVLYHIFICQYFLFNYSARPFDRRQNIKSKLKGMVL